MTRCGPSRPTQQHCDKRRSARTPSRCEGDTHHFRSLAANDLSTICWGVSLVFLPRPEVFLGGLTSSARRCHTASTPSRAIQFTARTTVFWARSCFATAARTALTMAVLPVPGEPEIYKAEVSSAGPAPKMKPSMNASMAAFSCSRPANCGPSLHVGRRSALARTCNGRRAEGGLGGGVAKESCESEVAGVEAAA